jgi:hypothetical protein
MTFREAIAGIFGWQLRLTLCKSGLTSSTRDHVWPIFK